jgi:hypothetical protein
LGGGNSVARFLDDSCGVVSGVFHVIIDPVINSAELLPIMATLWMPNSAPIPRAKTEESRKTGPFRFFLKSERTLGFCFVFCKKFRQAFILGIFEYFSLPLKNSSN